ncbi:MAG: SMI1/KNR4 family protein [Anaerolineales bacterium]
MNIYLKAEFDRLNKLLISVGIEFPDTDGAKRRDFRRIRKKTGIELFGDLVELYEIRNGSEGKLVFVVITDGWVPCEFLSVNQAIDSWGFYSSNPADSFERANRQYIGIQESPPRDVRIQQEPWWNKAWFPFAEFNGTQIFLDVDPSPSGLVGQIIAYQHDPDAIHYVAPDFLSFLKKSNDLLEKHSQELFQ